jgi:glycopeptide antibiotics resistance protein
MILISYTAMLSFITTVWCLVRALFAARTGRVSWKREVQLLLVYICFAVVARFTFFPFSTVNGQIQPLVFNSALVFPFRINWIPLVNLLDYPEIGDIFLNIMGNTTMFIPLGIVWPVVYPKLNTHKKAIAAGFGVSLCIEILQLPFHDRVTDVDDLLLNTAGYLLGYGLLLLVRAVRGRANKRKPGISSPN